MKHVMILMPVLVIAAFGVFEQFGVPRINGAGFSTTVEETYLKTMAAKLPGDCVAFYVAPTSPLRPIKLIRAPGFRRDLVSVNGAAR